MIMSGENLIKCLPGVGPLLNASSHALSRKAGAPDVKKAYQFRALVNTITHIFLTAVYFIPKVAASVPRFTPWVLGAPAVVSLSHYLACRFLLGMSQKEDSTAKGDTGSPAVGGNEPRKQGPKTFEDLYRVYGFNKENVKGRLWVRSKQGYEDALLSLSELFKEVRREITNAKETRKTQVSLSTTENNDVFGKAHGAGDDIPSSLTRHSTWLGAALEILKREGEIAGYNYKSYESSFQITLPN